MALPPPSTNFPLTSAETAQLPNSQLSAVGNLSLAYELALKQRDFEISQLTNRNNFFMIFQGVLIAGLVQSGGKALPSVNFALCLLGMVVSMYQTGMASGAKYWQIRWECAVKELEIRLLSTLQNEPFVMQLFTVDKQHLRPEDTQRLRDLHARRANLLGNRPSDNLSVEEGFINKIVEDDLSRGRGGWIVKKLILNRYSVSKIPIYVGIALTCFWGGLWLRTFAIDRVSIMSWIAEAVGWFRLAYLV